MKSSRDRVLPKGAKTVESVASETAGKVDRFDKPLKLTRKLGNLPHEARNGLKTLDLTGTMEFICRPDEIILWRCTDGTALIDARPDPPEIVGRVSQTAIRTMLAKGWIEAGPKEFVVTRQGQLAACCHFIRPA